MTISRPSSTTSSPEGVLLTPRRRGVVDGTLVVFRLGALSLLRGKRMVLLGILAALPLLLIVVSHLQPHASWKGALGFSQFSSVAYLRLVNVVACLFLGCAALGEEIEGKTMPLLLVRAIPRPALLLGRFFAYVLSTFVFMTPFVVASFVMIVLPMGREALWLDLPVLFAVLGGLLASIVAYGAVFMLVSVTVKRPLLSAIVLACAWESWAASMPLPVSDYTVVHHVYVLLLHWTSLPEYLSLSSIDSVEHYQSAGRAMMVLAGITVISLVLALARFRSKEYPA